YEGVAVAELYDHTYLIKAAGFPGVNEFYQLVLGVDTQRPLAVAHTVLDVMEEKMSGFFHALAQKAGLSEAEYKSLTYFQKLAITSAVLPEFPFADLSTSISLKRIESHELNNIYTFIRNVLMAWGEFADSEIEQVMRLVEFKRAEYPHYNYVRSPTNALERLYIEAPLHYYGLYILLEEIGHIVDVYQRYHRGEAELAHAESEQAALAFQARLAPQFGTILKQSFVFARSIPDDFGVNIDKKPLAAKRGFYLAHKVVQVLIEFALHEDLAGAVDLTQGFVNLTNFDTIRDKLLVSSPFRSLRENARVLYALAFDLDPHKLHKTPEWRMPVFVASQYPGPKSLEYFTSMLEDKVPGWQNLSMEEIKERLHESIDAFIAGI
ncbi:hypothetical protein HY408_00085, partial [Candidatus Gottesmanbacteria bacterium]|nr:hypothetical protein [Candidatus Gottesmanbacteria bacterium]